MLFFRSIFAFTFGSVCCFIFRLELVTDPLGDSVKFLYLTPSISISFCLAVTTFVGFTDEVCLIIGFMLFVVIGFFSTELI